MMMAKKHKKGENEKLNQEKKAKDDDEQIVEGPLHLKKRKSQ
jgi:hypothetical protein